MRQSEMVDQTVQMEADNSERAVIAKGPEPAEAGKPQESVDALARLVLYAYHADELTG